MNPNAISAFEYIGILISIILGLGITQILSSIAECVYNSKQIKFYFPHTIWVIIILFLHIQEWFIIYELKNYPVWKLPTFLFMLLYPIVLYIIAKLLFPPNVEATVVNFKEYFMQSFSKIYTLFSIAVFTSIFFNVFILNVPLLQQSLLFIPILIFISMVWFNVKLEWLHKLIAIVFIIIIIITTITEVNKWYIK